MPKQVLVQPMMPLQTIQRRPTRKLPKSPKPAPFRICRSVRFSHAEMIRTMTVGTDNTVYHTYPLSVSHEDAFPWLSGVARNFDLFQCISCTYRYVPSCSTFASGQVIMAFDYDATDVNDTRDISKYAAMPTHITGSVFRPLELRIDLTRARTQMPTKMIAVSDAEHLMQKCSYGNFYFLTSTVSQATNLGSLHVQYEMQLIDPFITARTGLGYSATMVASPIPGSPTNITLGPTVHTSTSPTQKTVNAIPPMLQNLVQGIVSGNQTNTLNDATVVQVLEGFIKQVGNALAVGTKASMLSYVSEPIVGDIANESLVMVVPAQSTGIQTVEYNYRLPITFTTSATVNYVQPLISASGYNLLDSFFALEDGHPTFPVAAGTYNVTLVGNFTLRSDYRVEQVMALNILFQTVSEATVLTAIVNNDVRVSADPGRYYFVRAVRGANY